jgi:uncharacterized protein
MRGGILRMKPRMNRAVLSKLAVLILWAAILSWSPIPGVFAQAPKDASDFKKTEVMIPARDGVLLNTAVYVPKTASRPLPIIFLRTPYGTGDTPLERVWGSLKELAADGYIFAFQARSGSTI